MSRINISSFILETLDKLLLRSTSSFWSSCTVNSCRSSPFNCLSSRDLSSNFFRSVSRFESLST
uniref:Uncharacterized protein n=1 Tax=Medicago truncatula TaxID=3880 RepID=I3SV69_MEDTR|nr:unknown [Medicago truncatula]